MEDTETEKAFEQIQIGDEPRSESSPKPSSFGLDGIEIFESLQEVKDLLNGRTKMAYIVSLYDAIPDDYLFRNYIDENLLDVYGFLQRAPDESIGILFDPTDLETEVSIFQDEDFNAHYAAIMLIQSMLYNGSSIKDIQEKWFLIQPAE